MYEHLRGTLARKRPTRVVVDVSGVGYELTIPLSSFDALPAEGSPALLYAHLHVRDDALKLYGFATLDERSFFRRLLEVSGIGPAVALSILSSTRYADFRAAVLAEDATALTRLKGVGKKLAQRMVLELKDVLAKEDPESAAAAAPAGVPASLREDAAAALVTLGFTRAQALADVDRVLTGPDASRDLGEVVRQALQSAR